MQPNDLGRLRERLLRAGVAPRHVHRYILELREHHADIVHSEVARGASRAEAGAIASSRLGTEDDLAESVLERTELRSIASRFPALAFGAAPPLVWVGLIAATATLVRTAGDRVASALGLSADAMFATAHALCVFHLRAAPVLLSIAMVVLCLRQRARPSWPMIGTALVCALAGTMSIHVLPSSLGNQLGVSSALLPLIVPDADISGPLDIHALAEGVACAALMLAVAWSPLFAWRLAAHRFES